MQKLSPQQIAQVQNEPTMGQQSAKDNLPKLHRFSIFKLSALACPNFIGAAYNGIMASASFPGNALREIPRTMTNFDLLVVLAHESGHAAMARTLGYRQESFELERQENPFW